METRRTDEPPRAVTREDVQKARVFVSMSDARAADADDIVQEALCALAFRRAPIETPAGRSAAETRDAFLHGAVARQVASHRRERARRGRLLASYVRAMPAGAMPSPEDLGPASDAAGTLARALRHLENAAPELHALLDALRRGETVATFAAARQIPIGTAWSRWRRAREAVRALLTRGESKSLGRA